MRMAIVAYYHGNGGAEKQITMLANAMARRGHEVYLIVLAENNRKYDLDDSVKLYDCSGSGKRIVLPILCRYKDLLSSYRTIKPDITIHYNLQSAYLTAAMPRRLFNTAVYSERGDPYDKEYNGLLGFIRSFTFIRLDGLVFQSEGARDCFNRSVKEKSIVIHNSVDSLAASIPVSSCRDNRIVSVGRFHEQKNHALLINAFNLISDSFPEIVLDIYGEGTLKEKLQSQINELGLTQRIHLLSPRKDILYAIRDARLFVLSSDYEGMPNALMEAMALGIPCVSTDCRPGGARTLIKDGINGFVVPRKDPIALADKMQQVLSDANVAAAISKGGREIVQTHTERKTFDKWESFLSQVCARAK